MALACDKQPNGVANGDLLHLEQVNEAIEKYGRKKSSLIPILQRVQEIYHYLPEDILTYVGTVLEIPSGNGIRGSYILRSVRTGTEG